MGKIVMEDNFPAETYYQSRCHCGWRGPRRGTLNRASMDAVQHDFTKHPLRILGHLAFHLTFYIGLTTILQYVILLFK